MTADAPASPLIAGIDFSSAPTRRKPIVIARCHLAREGQAGQLHADERPAGEPLRLLLMGFDRLFTLDDFDRWLKAGAAEPCRAASWIAGCDFPFGLPREFLAAQGWDRSWAGSMARVAALSRAELVERCRAFCAARNLPPPIFLLLNPLPGGAGATPTEQQAARWLAQAGQAAAGVGFVTTQAVAAAGTGDAERAWYLNPLNGFHPRGFQPVYARTLAAAIAREAP